ncbi:MAG: dienelactone hydrolase family protein [Mobilitalea sp.]
MTGIILFALIVYEAAFVIYCIRTASTQRKVKSYSRLLMFLVFFVLCLSPILDWGFRWYLLGILLLIQSLKALFVLYRRKDSTKQFKQNRIILKACFLIFIYAIVLIPAFVFPQVKELVPTGSYKVATVEATFTSDTIIDYFNGEKRSVNVAFWYPEGATSTYPLVVFSHGAFGVKLSNISAFEELASHGYVVCSIDHPGHSFYTSSSEGDTRYVDKAYMNEVINSNKEAYYTKAQVYDLIQKWMKLRSEDINMTIDMILQNVNAAADSGIEKAYTADMLPLYQSIDTSEIGVFGHSMGAAASVQIGRERSDVDAVINIDGPYFSEMTYDSTLDEFVATKVEYDKPILNIYSDQVWVQLKNDNETSVYAGNKISEQICKESYDVYLKGTKHLTLTDLSLVSPFLSFLLDGGERAEVDAKESIKLENSIILEFFNSTLKKEGTFTSSGVYQQ